LDGWAPKSPPYYGLKSTPSKKHQDTGSKYFPKYWAPSKLQGVKTLTNILFRVTNVVISNPTKIWNFGP
jgi:hypothetical protein